MMMKLKIPKMKKELSNRKSTIKSLNFWEPRKRNRCRKISKLGKRSTLIEHGPLEGTNTMI